MVVYFNNNFLFHEDVKISPFDRAFLFADGVYEVLRTYNGNLFRLEDHIKRLKYCINEIIIPFDDFGMIERVSKELADKNNITNDYSVYIQISRGISYPRVHDFSDNLSPNVFMFVKPINDNKQNKESGVKVILEKDNRWSRCDIKSTSLLPSVLANHKAVNANAYEAILFRDNFITEGSHTNFFAAKDDKIYTTPLSNYILDGVTRKVVLEICKRNHIYFIEEYIKVDELKSFDEFFITGTTTEITPVVQIDNLVINNGKVGKGTKLIQDLFFNYIQKNN